MAENNGNGDTGRMDCVLGVMRPPVSLTSESVQEGLSLLWNGRQYAISLGRNIWDFAVELPTLAAAGVTFNDIRCLVCAGYVQHAREDTEAASHEARRFCEEGLLTFSERTCFVLTERGAEALEVSQSHQNPSSDNGHGRASVKLPQGVTPVWDGERHKLWLGASLIKEYKLPSPNQEMVLSAFQEEGWPARIDDPLPPVADIVPKRRLHDTIKSLNRSQKRRLIRFLGDGTGEGVRWELQSSEARCVAIG